MSVSKVSLVNGALIELGAETIISFDENALAARLAHHRFDDILEQELQEGAWTFAKARAQLAAEATGPPFGYKYTHVLPANPYCLHVLKEVNRAEFIIEGRNALSNSTPLQIVYIKRITDMNDLSPLFRKALIYKIAATFAMPLTGSAKLKTGMETLYMQYIQAAQVRDSQQGTPQTAFDEAELDWVNARHTGVE